MNTAIEQNETAQAASEKPKAGKKGTWAKARAHVAPKKAKVAKKGAGAKKAPKVAKKAGVARDGSKAEAVLELLKKGRGRHPGGTDEGDWLAGA